MTNDELDAELDALKSRAGGLSVIGVLIQGFYILGKCINSCPRHLHSYVVTPTEPAPKHSVEAQIEEFHKKFHLEYTNGPRQLPKDLEDFRIRFMQEELDEYKRACETNDLEKQFDALIDLVYVAVGTSYLQGFPFTNGFNRVHMANMQKIRTPRPTERGGGWDVVKPEGWRPPNLKPYVNPRPERTTK